MTKKQIIIIFIISLFIGLGGGVIGGNLTFKQLKKQSEKDGNIFVPTEINKIKVEESSAIIDVVKKVSPSVVSVLTTTKIADIFGDVAEQKGGGTGFIITADGLIATNKHVVPDNGGSIKVVTKDGKTYAAKIQSIDPLNDFAVLKIDAKNLPVVDLGDSDDLEIGQQVVAIGNALGEFQNTVTSGIISAKERTITASIGAGNSETLTGLLQTDAAINPGNSGGPLVNLVGQVVGINVAKAGAENIGFAIPINSAKVAIESVIKTGKIIRPMLGVRYVPVTKELASVYDLSVDNGAWLVSTDLRYPAIISDGPADKAGIKERDILIKINDQEINEQQNLAYLLGNFKPNDKIKVTYIRDKKEKTVEVTLGELKE